MKLRLIITPRERWGEVHNRQQDKGKGSVIFFPTHHNVVPVDGDVGIPVGSVHLVHEAEGVEELVDYDLDNGDENNDNF